MVKFFNTQSLKVSAAVIIGVMAGAEEAYAGQTFSDIAGNIIASISDIPGLLTGVAYLLGTLLGVLGILKIKDHVENPAQTPLQHGAIRLTAGGGLFALPIIYEAMTETIGSNGANASAAVLNSIDFAVTGP